MTTKRIVLVIDVEDSVALTQQMRVDIQEAARNAIGDQRVRKFRWNIGDLEHELPAVFEM